MSMIVNNECHRDKRLAGSCAVALFRIKKLLDVLNQSFGRPKEKQKNASHVNT